jgi:hypothetical protein
MRVDDMLVQMILAGRSLGALGTREFSVCAQWILFTLRVLVDQVEKELRRLKSVEVLHQYF